MNKKTVIVLEHNGGRLGNQLWNLANIYAYCLERGYACKDYSFFDYDRFFSIPIFQPLIDPLLKVLPGRIRRKIYSFLVRKIKDKKDSSFLSSEEVAKNEAVRFYLPPSPNENKTQQAELAKAEESLQNNIYTLGWMFRNPEGLQKFHSEIVSFLTPSKTIKKKIDRRINELRRQHTSIVGVHIRQGDYRNFDGGKFFFNQEEVRDILHSYIDSTTQDTTKTFFIICSDEPINKDLFSDFSYDVNNGGAVEDLFTLSATDKIIGSDSTFGGFASFYGNIPIIFFSKEGMDWQTFEKRKSFTYKSGSYTMQL